MESELVIADLIEGIPPPSDGHALVGHESLQAALLEQYASGKIHHAVLLSGTKGIGKVSLALRMASHVFNHPEPETAPNVVKELSGAGTLHSKITAGSHPNLLHLTRPWNPKTKKFKTRLTVEEVRQTVHFFGTARGENGWRIAVVDALDDMNANASNALLKILEEPPERTIFFIIAHSLGSVMPTIRSRCMHMPMKPLDGEQVLMVLDEFGVSEDLPQEDRELLVQLSGGSVRTAIVLAQQDGLSLYRSFQRICANLTAPDWRTVHQLADGIVQRGKEDRYRLLLKFVDQYLHANATGQNAAYSSISSLARWAQVWEKAQKSARTAESYNLDRKQVIINLIHEMGEVARV
ncbi:MAG: DNA polymerase III subunit delta' [Pseudomonadota bacterium]